MSDLKDVKKPPQASNSKRTKTRKVTPPKFHYLRGLPREIREQIYQLLLINDAPISIEANHTNDFDCRFSSSRELSIETNLLLVNKIIHDEAAPVL